MLGFKEYALLTFDHSFTERIRNHFLKYVGPDLFLYNLDTNFLQSLTDSDGDKAKAVEYFIGQIDTAGTIYNKLYNGFLGPNGIQSKEGYYRLAAYYTKLNGLTSKPTQGKNIVVASNDAIKEIFAEKLYDYLLSINTIKSASESEKQPLFLEVKKTIQKTFVPDFAKIKQAKTYNLLEKEPFSVSPDTLLYDNITTTFEGRMLTIKSYKCAGAQTVPAYTSKCGPNTSDLCGKFGCTEEQKAKIARLENLVNLYKQNINIEKTNFPDSDGFPYIYVNFDSNNLGNYKENQFSIDRSGLKTTKQTTFSNLLSNGIYVEYFFKFDFDELLGNMVFKPAYQVGLTKLLDELNGYPLVDMVSSVAKRNSKSPIGKGRYNSTSYFSLDGFSQIIKLIYLYLSRETWTQVQNQFLMGNTPSELEIDKAFENTKIEFGARLIVSTPNLENETNSDKITSVYKQFPQKYESSFDPKKYADGSQNNGVTEARDQLLKDAEKYSELKSGWKNKAFVYNLLNKEEKTIKYKVNEYDFGTAKLKEKVQELVDLNVQTYYCFPIAEKSVELTKEDKKEFLLDFYANVPRFLMKGVPIQLTGMPHVDFSLDQAVVGKYSENILDFLFEDEFVKKFFSSSLIGQKFIGLDDPEVYKGIIEKQDVPLFDINSNLGKAHIFECNKTDDKIDQNLITLIDSIEGY